MNVSLGLRKSLEVAKNNPMVFVPMLAASVFGVVLSLVVVGSAVPVIAGLGSDPSSVTAQQAFAGIGAAIGGGFIVALISGIVGLFAHGMTVAMANMALGGESPTLASGWERLRARLVPVVVASLLLGLIIGFGTLLLVIPGLVAAFLLVFTIVSVMVDNVGPVEALGRSLTTVTRNFGSTFVFFLVILALAIVSGIIGGIVGAIPFLGAILTMVVSAAFTGFVTIFTLYTYRELSAASEGGTDAHA